MIFRYFAHAFVDRFALQCVDRFATEVPNHKFEFNQTKKSPKHVRKTNQALQQLLTSLQRFNSEQKLNIFQRARLGQQLQNQLISRGYPPQFARDIAAEASKLRNT